MLSSTTPCHLYALSPIIMRAHRPRKREKIPKQSYPKEEIPNITVGFGAGRKEPMWQCAKGCGACCKLAKGPAFATPEEIFSDPSDVQLYRSLVGRDGWCIHYEKTTRTCSIYADRPYFCRVEPEVFSSLYGINKNKFNKEACSSCRDTIKAVYGSNSKELENFNQTLRKAAIS